MATKKKMLQAAAGQAGAGGAGLDVDEVFSTYVYTGTNSLHKVTNNLDLSTEGGLLWAKSRSSGGTLTHYLMDSERGLDKHLSTNLTGGQVTRADMVSSFDTDGYTLSSNVRINSTSYTYVNWAFRKAPKFFDVVTYTGTGSAAFINHNLGSVPGTIFVKCTSATSDWFVHHRSLGTNGSRPNYLKLNTTSAVTSGSSTYFWTPPTDTYFGAGGALSSNGATYVAYLFAHNDGDGEFGPDGDADIIKCGSYTGDGTTNGTNEVTLGFEPQWILTKRSDSVDNWHICDVMRGQTTDGITQRLRANTSAAESANYGAVPTPTGFKLYSDNSSGGTYIYIAIRRGPMAVPESATDVFDINERLGGYPTPTLINTGNEVDLLISKRAESSGGSATYFFDRLRGGIKYLRSTTTGAEAGTTEYIEFDTNEGFREGFFNTSENMVHWTWKRAPSFFDIVAYTGNGTAGRTVSHNLGVAPELIIVKNRTYNGSNWIVWCDQLTRVTEEPFMILNATNGKLENNAYWNNGAHTNSVFETGSNLSVNGSGYSHIAYLFATVPGVSKVGSYTGNGTSQTIDCGFTSGARFILIKRTDSTGDWYVWDTERGIVAGNDPHLSLNTTAAEVTSDDSIDPDNSGFVVNQVGATNINVSSASYIFYSVA